MPEPGAGFDTLDLSPTQLRIVREILARHADGLTVWAFGSRARGCAKPYSDLDLALITDRPMDLARQTALADAFEQSDLPCRVDLVDWATTGEAFRRIIERDHVVVQPGKPEHRPAS
ncbi:MAG: nucleotidyltransferase domain-containing protein [Pseudomonadota bacterium]|nr:nucleotidyltransferase domain-containing protein [Pseudomonadota bacterium]